MLKVRHKDEQVVVGALGGGVPCACTVGSRDAALG